MKDREALVQEVMEAEQLTRAGLCRALGCAGTATNPLLEWERGNTPQFRKKFWKYLASFPSSDREQLPSLAFVFPNLADSEEETSDAEISLEGLTLHDSKFVDDKKVTPIRFDVLWSKHPKNHQVLAGLAKTLTSNAKRWISRQVVPTPRLKLEDDGCLAWVPFHKASVVLCHGRAPMTLDSPLLHAFVLWLGFKSTRPRYVFFRHCVKGVSVCDELSDWEILNVLEFLRSASILIVLSEFQQEPALAGVIKQLQDAGSDSSHPCGMLLYGSDRSRVRAVASDVFYCVPGVSLTPDFVPTKYVVRNHDQEKDTS